MAEGELVRRGRSNISSQYVKEIKNGNNAELALVFKRLKVRRGYIVSSTSKVDSGNKAKFKYKQPYSSVL
jgi:hypothetical protein